jgi:hypothetical protein
VVLIRFALAPDTSAQLPGSSQSSEHREVPHIERGERRIVQLGGRTDDVIDEIDARV